MRLHLGCGPTIAEGWENVDVVDYGQEHVADLLTVGLPFPDAHFDYAVTHHMLQMVGYHDLLPALVEVRRVMKPGGWIRVSVPDFHRAMLAYLHDEHEHFLVADEVEPSIVGKLLAYLTWYSTARTIFTPAWLAEWCTRAGFIVARPVGYGRTVSGHPDITTLDSRKNESCIVEAQR